MKTRNPQSPSLPGLTRQGAEACAKSGVLLKSRPKAPSGASKGRLKRPSRSRYLTILMLLFEASRLYRWPPAGVFEFRLLSRLASLGGESLVDIFAAFAIPPLTAFPARY